jgi:chemotaxis response regulator CheB
MPKIKVAIVDDHAHFRKSIKMALAIEPAIEVILEAKNGKELIDQLPAHLPDVILMDIQMPVMDGIEVLWQRLCEEIRCFSLAVFNGLPIWDEWFLKLGKF